MSKTDSRCWGIGLACILLISTHSVVKASNSAESEKAIAPTVKTLEQTGERPRAEDEPAETADSEVPVAYNLKVRALQERVNQLKERIFQSKSRLLHLQEVALDGSTSTGRTIIIHENDMGNAFRLKRVQYALDGKPIFNWVDMGNGEFAKPGESEIFNGIIAPGTHQLAVLLEYQGYGYGVFSYLRGYTFKLKSSYTLSVEAGKSTTLRVVGYDRGGIIAPLLERPAVRYDIERAIAFRSKEDSTTQIEVSSK